MVLPIELPRSEHTLSRRDVDPDALKVLFRLQQLGHTAYLVGGSVRDLLLNRRPKDFDIGTSASPHEIKRAFRNCWIIGRRFRLAHVKFGTKTIEVATFRRNVRADAEEEVAEARLLGHTPPPEGADSSREDDPIAAGAPSHEEDVRPGDVDGNRHDAPTYDRHIGHRSRHDFHDRRRRHEAPLPALASPSRELLIHRDNAYGTPEEDAFRRDFTINALFYDAGTKTIIDYVGGLADLKAGVVRSIGDPLERFQEDPVRMLRAVVMAERLDFKLDEPILSALDTLGPHIRHAAPARLLEEYFKILRSGHAEKVFAGMARAGLVEHISPEMEEGLSEEFFISLARLDAFRGRFESAPDTLTNTILLGSLLIPLGLMEDAKRRYGVSQQWYPALGRLPIPKKDVERLTHAIALQPRLMDLDAPQRAQQSLLHRSVFREALTWLEIYGDAPDVVRHWHAMLQDPTPSPNPHAPPPADGFDDQRRRRRRRRRRPFHAIQP